MKFNLLVDNVYYCKEYEKAKTFGISYCYPIREKYRENKIYRTYLSASDGNQIRQYSHNK